MVGPFSCRGESLKRGNHLTKLTWSSKKGLPKRRFLSRTWSSSFREERGCWTTQQPHGFPVDRFGLLSRQVSPESVEKKLPGPPWPPKVRLLSTWFGGLELGMIPIRPVQKPGAAVYFSRGLPRKKLTGHLAGGLRIAQLRNPIFAPTSFRFASFRFVLHQALVHSAHLHLLSLIRLQPVEVRAFGSDAKKKMPGGFRFSRNPPSHQGKRLGYCLKIEWGGGGGGGELPAASEENKQKPCLAMKSGTHLSSWRTLLDTTKSTNRNPVFEGIPNS